MKNRTKPDIFPYRRLGRTLTRAGAASILFLASPSVALAQGYGYWGRETMMGYGHGLFGGWIMILFWAAVAVGIYFLVKQLVRPAGDNAAKPRSDVDAFEILKGRYARGEIGRDEFHRMRDEIRTV